MVICPQCQKVSQSDKICDYCWHDFKAKPRKKTTRDLTKMPLSNLIILTVMFLAFCVFLLVMGKTISPVDNSTNNTSTNNSK